MPKQKPKFAVLSVIIALAAIAMFIWADRKLAPPYPHSPTNDVSGAKSTDIFGETTSTNVIFTK